MESIEGKQVPSQPLLKADYELAFDPAAVVKAEGLGAAFPFTREFEYPEDQVRGVQHCHQAVQDIWQTLPASSL